MSNELLEIETDIDQSKPILILQKELALHEESLYKSLECLKKGLIDIQKHAEHCAKLIPKIYAFDLAINKLKESINN